MYERNEITEKQRGVDKKGWREMIETKSDWQKKKHAGPIKGWLHQKKAEDEENELKKERKPLKREEINANIAIVQCNAYVAVMHKTVISNH